MTLAVKEESPRAAAAAQRRPSRARRSHRRHARASLELALLCTLVGALGSGVVYASGQPTVGPPTTREADGPGWDPFEAGSFAFRVFRDADGLPQNTVHALTLDREGYLWVGTQDGAAAYNGRTWAQATLPTRLKSNWVRAILSGSDGSVWFGTQAAGLCRLHAGTWSVVPIGPDPKPDERVNALLETRDVDGTPLIWVGTHNSGVACLRGDTWTSFDTSDGLPSNRVWSLLATAETRGRTTLLVGTERGLARLAAGSARFVSEEGFPTASVNSLIEITGPEGSTTLWAGTYGQGLGCRRAGSWRFLSASDGLPTDFVTSLAATGWGIDEGGVWVGTDGGGLALVVDGEIRTLDISSGLPSNSIYALLRTDPAEGTAGLWVGTRNGGLGVLRQGQWRVFSPVPGAPSLPVNAILESRTVDGSQAMWFGTDGGGLAMLTEGGWKLFDHRSGALPNDIVQCLLETSAVHGEKPLWVGTRNGGLARFAAGQWTTFSVASGALPNDMVQVLAEVVDGEGNSTVWVGTRRGLARFLDDRWEQFGTTDGLPHTSILSLASARASRGPGAMWIGTAGGLALYHQGRIQTIDTASMLLNQSVPSLREVIGPDGRPSLWVGTDGGGVSRLDLAADPPAWLTLTDDSSPALPNNVISDVLEDREHRLYLLTNRGVTRLTSPSPFARAPEAWELFTFKVEDGLPSGECTRGSGLVDSRGRVWVGTVGGAAAFDPTLERIDRTSKRLHVAGTLVAEGERPLAPRTELRYWENHVVFEYALSSFFRERDTRYRTQLAGLDPQPSPWMSDSRKEYRTLPAGEYVFRVWGMDYAGNTTGPSEIALAIRPAPWQTWWFSSLVLAAIVAIGAVIAHARLRAAHRRERALDALVKARTRELQEANQILVDLSYLDPLTGVANRRRFDERLDAEWRRAVRTGTILSVVMIDIDHFKPFNDTYGHQRGDDCLREVAATLLDGLPRTGDSLARYGGEEFVVILPSTDRAGAAKVADHLRHRVERLGVPTSTSSVGRVVTISCGVGTVRPTLDFDAASLIRLADSALYRAKQGGRNQTRAEEAEQTSSASLGLS